LPIAVPPRPAFLDGPLRLYIGGHHVSTDDRMATVDPATGETLAEFPVASPAQVDLAVQAADALRGCIWTSDTSRALRLAEELEAGTVWINTYGMFDVAVAFGSRKHSGFGRELGKEALEPYLTSKPVWVDLQSAAAQAGQAISR
jgi:acyl-CoA reductase-like NAD-dependent aldehyde dehydrogenase